MTNPPKTGKTSAKPAAMRSTASTAAAMRAPDLVRVIDESVRKMKGSKQGSML